MNDYNFLLAVCAQLNISIGDANTVAELIELIAVALNKLSANSARVTVLEEAGAPILANDVIDEDFDGKKASTVPYFETILADMEDGDLKALQEIAEAEKDDSVDGSDPNSHFAGEDGYVTFTRKTDNEDRVYKYASLAQWKKNKGESRKVYKISAIAVLETGGTGASGKTYKNVLLTGTMFHDDGSSVPIKFQSNTQYLSAVQGIWNCEIDSDGLPIVSGDSPLWCNLIVKEAKANKTISMVTDSERVAILELADAPIIMRRKKKTGFIVDATTSEQVSFQRIDSICDESVVDQLLINIKEDNAISSRMKEYGMRKDVDLASLAKGAKEYGKILKALVAGGMTQETALQFILNKTG
jgi:hypothetical protein